VLPRLYAFSGSRGECGGGPLIIAAGIWVIVAYGTSGGGWFVGLCLISWGAAVLKDVLESNWR
jgi:hypothetical protein